ncbi:Pyruvate/Phosphoenolpyruvate kinase-like domain-containing protein [Aspergillus pseudoustus]|uniref:Pyruvate/Phosphoenolpyruvate kinase-like domain-containing protein n=1 Tax=Aspergillus pseudoustus TaxID=1810923 RepID=A0ABR4J278_9EURO
MLATGVSSTARLRGKSGGDLITGLSSTTNRVKKVLSCEGRVAFGVWQLLPGINLARTLARADYDWVLVNCEHGNISGSTYPPSLCCGDQTSDPLLLQMPPCMRQWPLYGFRTLTMVLGALDAGAHGLLAPLIRTVDDAKSLRFSRGPSATQYLLEANVNILLSVQIETKEALEDVKEITAVDGIDLLFVGPFDLGNNIGFPVRNNHIAPQLEQAISKVLQAAHGLSRSLSASSMCCSSTHRTVYLSLIHSQGAGQRHDYPIVPTRDW